MADAPEAVAAWHEDEIQKDNMTRYRKTTCSDGEGSDQFHGGDAYFEACDHLFLGISKD